VFAHRQNSLGYFAQAIFAVGLGAAALTVSASSASAQNNGFFESLFGGKRWNNGPTAYADPFSQFNPFGSRPAETTPRAATAGDGGSVAFCVRTCDGRYFPIQRHSGVTPAQACSSFCPASQTKIYNGSTIENASADGKRYADLSTAFVYREKIVPGCTCNGKDAFGLVTPPIEEDATLRQGDIVATSNGLMAYNGSNGRRQAANYTPIGSYGGLSSELRRKLTETKIAPAVEASATPAQIKPLDAKAAADVDTTGSIRKIKGKRVQVER
jgi:hypothetical protein